MTSLQHQLIDYRKLATACEYYRYMGYIQIEVPWLVSKESSLATSPTGDIGYAYATDTSEYLVCSAEQGFIEMMSDDLLPADIDYFSVSACFRDEFVSPIRSRHFMKLELFSIVTNPTVDEEKALRYCTDAQRLFKIAFGVETFVVRTPDGYDIVDEDNLELGSYGLREIEGRTVVYGTGLALPRISIARKKDGIPHKNYPQG